MIFEVQAAWWFADCGVEFRTFQGAREYADAITCHLQNSLSGEWIGWRVDVRNADGMKFFSMPV
jgi:hypothetical protein